jgi:hypothetical protein
MEDWTMNSWEAVLAERISRRSVLAGGLGASALAFLGGFKSPSPLLGFTPVPPSKQDAVVVPPEYAWEVVHAWGDPILLMAPEFKPDASQPASDPAGQAGMGHDGMEFFSLMDPGSR